MTKKKGMTAKQYQRICKLIGKKCTDKQSRAAAKRHPKH